MLVVEDDAAIRGLLAAALRREPLTVDVAADGIEALSLVASNSYSVIITDLMLPRLDGASFIEEFTRIQPNAGCIIFIMTAVDEPVSVRRLGPVVHALIRKPFDVGKLVEMIRECARLRDEHSDAIGEFMPPSPPTLTDVC